MRASIPSRFKYKSVHELGGNKTNEARVPRLRRKVYGIGAIPARARNPRSGHVRGDFIVKDMLYVLSFRDGL